MKKIVGAAVTVVVVGVLYVGVGSIDADPPDVSSFTTTSTVPADEDNAWCGFVAATNAVKRWVESPDWKKLSPDEIDTILAENDEAISLFKNAAHRAQWYDASARREGSWPGRPILMLMKIYSANVERKIAHGEIASTVEGISDLLAFGRIVQSDAESIICWRIVGLGRDMALDLALQVVESGKASDEEMRCMLAALLADNSETLRKSVRQAINNEIVYFYGNEQSYVEAEMCSAWSHRLTSRFAYHPNQTMKERMKLAGRARELLSCDYDGDACALFESEFRAALPIFCGGRLTPNYVGWRCLAVDFAGYSELPWVIACGEFKVAAAKFVVAVELYRRKTGRRPVSLDALVPEFLPSVPVDPFDHGAPLKYDVERGIVWTVGPDRDFNGEKLSGKESYGRNRIYVVNLDGSKVK